VTCAKNGMSRRHNSVRDCWGDLLRQSVVPHVKEASSTSNDRPADLLLVGFSRGLDWALDFTVTSPCTLDQYPLTPGTARKHVSLAENAKSAHNQASCDHMRWECCPMAYSVWGGEGPGAKRVFYEVLRRATADLQGWQKTERAAEMRQALSLTLAREVARQLPVRCRVNDDASLAGMGVASSQ
jgi:hypothetical protein